MMKRYGISGFLIVFIVSIVFLTYGVVYSQQPAQPPKPVQPIKPIPPGQPGQPVPPAQQAKPSAPQSALPVNAPNQPGSVNAPGISNASGAVKKVEDEVYVYNPKNRRDPFLSVITARLEKKKEEDRRKKNRPLERYDLGEIKLLAVVKGDKNKSYALIKLPDNKFYNIKIGTTLGVNNGKVKRIDDDKIVVTESVLDVRGNAETRDITLKLRKEEEE